MILIQIKAYPQSIHKWSLYGSTSFISHFVCNPSSSKNITQKCILHSMLENCLVVHRLSKSRVSSTFAYKSISIRLAGFKSLYLFLTWIGDFIDANA